MTLPPNMSPGLACYYLDRQRHRYDRTAREARTRAASATDRAASGGFLWVAQMAAYEAERLRDAIAELSRATGEEE